MNHNTAVFFYWLIVVVCFIGLFCLHFLLAWPWYAKVPLYLVLLVVAFGLEITPLDGDD